MAEERKLEKKESSESDVMLWMGAGALGLAAIALTIYVVQKKREEELDVMREAPRKESSSVASIIASGRRKLACYWDSLSGTVNSLLATEQVPPLEVNKVGAYDGSPESAFAEDPGENV